MSTQSPKISIIVPVYKVEQYLPKCIDSILFQTYQDWELLLIDDGSPDNSGNICDEYAFKDERIRVFHKENGGVSSARNLGIDNANGEWIWFVDADDFVENESLSIIYNSILEHQGNELCFYFGLNRIVGDKKYMGHNSPEIFKSLDYVKKILSYSVSTGPVLYIYRYDFIKQIRFDTELQIGEDLCFHLQVMMTNKDKYVVVKEDNIYNYYVNPESVMQINNLSFIEKYNRLSCYIYDNVYCKTSYENLQICALVNIYINFSAVFKRLYENIPHKSIFIEKSEIVRSKLLEFPIKMEIINKLPSEYSRLIKSAIISNKTLWRVLFLLKLKSLVINNIKKLIKYN